VEQIDGMNRLLGISIDIRIADDSGAVQLIVTFAGRTQHNQSTLQTICS
jgi:hypothetical protein